jgi:membrane-associated phospholipid phosphatase
LQNILRNIIFAECFAVAVCISTRCQTVSSAPTPLSAKTTFARFPGVQAGLTSFPTDSGSQHSEGSSDAQNPAEPQHGLIVRSIKRGLWDQKKLYAAPFKVSNLKWDALFLAGTAALLATDKRTQEALPGGNVGFYGNISNVSLGSMSGALVALWAYGIKTDNARAKEAGQLELETLANTFLIYAPMQLIAGRQRPGEGSGNGDFLKHHAFNTSFPGGHAMFMWAMASVVAREYPRPWVKILAYGAAGVVSTGRLLGRDHFTSDILVGSALGYVIGRYVFHLHCEPGLSESCHR